MRVWVLIDKYNVVNDDWVDVLLGIILFCAYEATLIIK